jgi:hypothetical protein
MSAMQDKRIVLNLELVLDFFGDSPDTVKLEAELNRSFADNSDYRFPFLVETVVHSIERLISAQYVDGGVGWSCHADDYSGRVGKAIVRDARSDELP